MDIKTAIEIIFDIANIQTKQDLDKWCGDMGRKRLYLKVQQLAPEHWDRIKTPECSVRYCYRGMLTGY